MNSRACDGFGSLRVFDFRRLMTIILVNGAAIFTISYAPETYKLLDWIEVKYHRLVATTIEEQLSHTPAAETRNRKPLEEPAPFGAPWKLRSQVRKADRNLVS